MAVENCDNCGVCCMGQNLQPLTGNVLDRALQRALPALWQALETVADGPLKGDDNCPCIWLNRFTGKCRNYQLRPPVCRDLIQPGDETCLRLRREAGIKD